jgi:fusaric acid resistance family protein
MVTDDIWLLVQGTAAATVAWLIAKHLVDHRQPFFAPISALVSLNTALGERGLNALRLLQGVVVGIGVAELTLVVVGGGYGSLALAVFAALVLARALGSARIVLAQAAGSAVLTIAVANGEAGPQRLFDALIGAGVALVFSQLLFSPEPLRLLRRVEADALAAIAAALGLTAEALEGDEELAERAIGSQRELRDRLSELARTRRASGRVARHTLAWRTHIGPVVRENEDAGYLDLLGGSCLLLTRTSLEADAEDRRLLAPYVRALSGILSELAERPGDQATRQRAVDRSLEVLRGMRSLREEPNPELTAALAAARIAVTDLMLFVGVDPVDARAAIRQEEREEQSLEVPAPASARRPRLRSFGRWRR